MIEHVERELEVEASVKEVWHTITGAGWLADEVELELRPGGGASFRWEASERSGWVEEAMPPGDADDAGARLAFWWASDGETSTRVEVTITPSEMGTRVRVVESRPLEVLDLIGVPLHGSDQAPFGPAMVAA